MPPTTPTSRRLTRRGGSGGRRGSAKDADGGDKVILRRAGRRPIKKTRPYSDDNPSTFTTKHKKGQEPPAPTSRSSHGRTLSRDTSRGSISRQDSSSASHKRKTIRILSQPSLPDEHRGPISHRVRRRSIWETYTGNKAAETAAPSLNDAWKEALAPEMDEPAWSPKLGSMTDSLRGRSMINCICYHDRGNFVMCGDSIGQLHLYSTSVGKTMQLIRVYEETCAHKRYQKMNDQKLRKGELPPCRIISIAILSTIQSSTLAVYSSVKEVECISVQTGAVLWTIASVRPVHDIQLRRTPTYQESLLCSMEIQSSNGASTTTATDEEGNSEVRGGDAGSSLLWILDFEPTTEATSTTSSEGLWKVRPQTICSTPQQFGFIPNNVDSLGSKVHAIWDGPVVNANKVNSRSILMVAFVNGLQQELWRVVHHRPATQQGQQEQQQQQQQWKVLTRVELPQKGSRILATLSICSNDEWVLVAGTRGIRVLDRKTLSSLLVVGDSLVLHSHTLAWQSAMTISASQHDVRTIMGVPCQQREPRELQDVLHLWTISKDVKGSRWVVATSAARTISPPIPKTHGYKHVYSDGNNIWGVTAEKGELWALEPVEKSDWAGIMYPPGYQVIDNNLEYIEDEDEHDVAIATVSDDKHETKLSKASKENAMEIEEDESIPDWVLKDQDESVDVTMNTIDYNLSLCIPCVPDPVLREQVIGADGGSVTGSVSTTTQQGDGTGQYSSSEFCDFFLADVMPSVAAARKLTKKGASSANSNTTAASAAPLKRGRQATLEAMRKASLNPTLRKGILAREQWGDGDGSTALSNDQQCVACVGRSVIHTCGNRELPVDYDAIREREEKAKQEALEADRKLKAEKRRLADARRREAKRRHKEEEERRLGEQRKQEEEERRRRTAMLQRLSEESQQEDSNIAQNGKPQPGLLRRGPRMSKATSSMSYGDFYQQFPPPQPSTYIEEPEEQVTPKPAPAPIPPPVLELKRAQQAPNPQPVVTMEQKMPLNANAVLVPQSGGEVRYQPQSEPQQLRQQVSTVVASLQPHSHYSTPVPVPFNHVNHRDEAKDVSGSGNGIQMTHVNHLESAATRQRTTPIPEPTLPKCTPERNANTEAAEALAALATLAFARPLMETKPNSSIPVPNEPSTVAKPATSRSIPSYADLGVFVESKPKISHGFGQTVSLDPSWNAMKPPPTAPTPMNEEVPHPQLASPAIPSTLVQGNGTASSGQHQGSL